MAHLPKHIDCIIVGASHSGVTCAFELRKQGFEGSLCLIDMEPWLPYHKPPLSKAFLLEENKSDELGNQNEKLPAPLKAQAAYDNANILCLLGYRVLKINSDTNELILRNITRPENTEEVSITYEKLVLATGATPILPKIAGLIGEEGKRNFHVMRTAEDAMALKRHVRSLMTQRAESGAQSNARPISLAVIGAGYIGLEAAASLSKMGVKVTVIEREQRILARVASVTVSQCITQLHEYYGVHVATQAQVQRISTANELHRIYCSNDEVYTADMILVGVGVSINSSLASTAGINTLATHGNGIVVNSAMQTNKKNVWAIGDCTVFPTHDAIDSASTSPSVVTLNEAPPSTAYAHVESVQNALDQAKVAAASICGKAADYRSVPWFWSDQFDYKLQIVGLAKGAESTLTRRESNKSLSVWHLIGSRLICVEAINAPKAYVLGGRWIAQQAHIDGTKLVNNTIALSECIFEANKP